MPTAAARMTADAVADVPAALAPVDDTTVEQPAASAALAEDGTTEDGPTEDGPTKDSTTDDATTDGPPPEAPVARPRSLVTLAVATVTAAALVFAVVAAVMWWRADHDAARHRGLLRDRALLGARIDIQTVSTSDYRHPGATLDSWLSVSTGALHDQFGQSRTSATTLLREAKVITTATVLDAAVVTLNAHRGTATVIASVNLRKQPATGSAATSRNRLRASLTRVGSRWKLSDLQVVSVRLS